MELTPIRELKPDDRDKVIEAKVYRAWAARNPPNTTEKGYCAILLDIEGNPIQANTDAADIHHFRPILIPGKAFRISEFQCRKTENWQQTLENKTSLFFNTLTKLDPIPSESFPNHYFNFVSYNQLPKKLFDPRDKGKKEYPVLTDYIGCYITSGDAGDIGDPNKNQARIRKVEIQNLNRNSVELTLWDQLADEFEKEKIEALERPIIIAVTSCKVSKYQNRELQLSSTPATYYYINPKIPELEQYKAAYKQLYEEKEPLYVTRYRLPDAEQEKKKNRIPIATLLTHDPESYRGVRFSCQGTITGLNTSRGWYYTACSAGNCSQKATKINGSYECKKHGIIPAPNYRYNFRATITDGTKPAQFIFFTPKADEFVSVNCANLVASNDIPQPGHFPKAIENIVGTSHLFQFHYNPTCVQGCIEFVIDEVFGITDQVKQIEGQPSGTHAPPKLLPPTDYIPIPTIDKRQPENESATNVYQPEEIGTTIAPYTSPQPTFTTSLEPLITHHHSATTPTHITQPQQDTLQEKQQEQEMSTPPMAYTEMQTRSKTEMASDVGRKPAKRALFAEESSETKKKKN